MCSSFPGLLIGRTAVHSGKDPAFVAYDQFLSTGILQPLSRGEVRCGSVSVIRRCWLNVRFARKRTRSQAKAVFRRRLQLPPPPRVVEVFVAQNSDRSRPSCPAQIGLKPNSSRTTTKTQLAPLVSAASSDSGCDERRCVLIPATLMRRVKSQ